MNILTIFVLGGLGGILRYSLEGLGSYGTLLVNLSGCLILGFLVGMTNWRKLPNWLHGGVSTGFIGSLTTFASFINIVQHLSATNLWESVAYLAVTAIGGILCGYTGEQMAYLVLRRSNQQYHRNQQQGATNTGTVTERSWQPSNTEPDGN